MIYRPRSEEKEMDIRLCIAVGLLCFASRSQAYQNLTVGGTAGWFFDAVKNSSVTDYSKWASAQNSSLGDYLIFNTNTNYSVIQTYNETTFTSCNYDDSQDDDTLVWSAVDPTLPTTTVQVSVPLTIEGMNYFFSSSLDGIECMNGMQFKINVSHGEGLPQSLRHPPPPPFAEPPDSTGNDNSSTSDFPAVTSPPLGSGSLRISSLEALVLSVVVSTVSLVVHLC